MKNKKARTINLIIVPLLILIILIGLLTPIFNTGTTKFDKRDYNTNYEGLTEINIYCSNQHNHPLFQNKTICAYVPDLESRFKCGVLK